MGPPPGGYAAALAGGAPGGPKPPPVLPPAGGQPQPTMAGAMRTGGGSMPPKVAIGTAIENLREVKSQYPEAASDVDSWIAQLQSMANPAKPVPSTASPAPLPAGGGEPPS